MRLAATGKYLSANQGTSKILCVAFSLLFFSTCIKAQTYKQTFHNVPLSEALVQVSKLYDIKVAFDADKLGTVNVEGEFTGNTKDELISKLLAGTGFEFRYRYSRYLIIEKKDREGAALPEKGQMIGSISDRETGEHLPYATVIYYGRNLMTSASENGNFCIRNICENPLHLMISYIGYVPLDTTIKWENPVMNFDFRLERKIHMLDTIVVKGEKLEMIDLRNDVDFAATIDPTKLSDLPVLAETDVFRMLRLLPGVSYSDNSSGLSIRGGSSDQNLVLFDGQTLYNLSHYYGVISAINPNVIKDLQIYKGGYDSRFGERVSGIVDITGKSGNQSKPLIYGDINLLNGNITAEIPVSKKITFIGALRRSYSDIYSTSFAGRLFEPASLAFGGDSVNIINQTRPKFSFYDYNAKLTFRPNNLETFSIGAYNGKDFFRNSYTGTAQSLIVDATDKNMWSNYGISASWLRQWNESFFSNLQAGASGYSNDYSNSTSIDRSHSTNFNNQPFLPDSINYFNTFNQNELKDYYFSMRNTLRISNSNQLNFGALSRQNSIYYHKDADKVYVYDNTYQKEWTSSAYIQDKITAGNKLTIKPGLRLTYFSGTGKVYAEPRFSVNYRINDGFSLRAATGKYYQFINQVTARQETGYNKNFWVLANDSIHPAVSSNHYIFGFTAGNDEKIQFDAEVYYKVFSGLQEYIYLSQFLKNSDFPDYFDRKFLDPAPEKQKPSYFVTGTGRSYGIDLLLKLKARNFTSWLSYSYGRSLQKYSLINYGHEIPGPNDQPHQFALTNMLTAGKWNFGSVTVFTSGKAYPDARSSVTPPIVREYRRLPNYFRTDLSANYNFTLGKVRLKTGATFINIFNTRNFYDINTRKFDFANNSFSETTLIQSQAFSLNLFIHFLF